MNRAQLLSTQAKSILPVPCRPEAELPRLVPLPPFTPLAMPHLLSPTPRPSIRLTRLAPDILHRHRTRQALVILLLLQILLALDTRPQVEFSQGRNISNSF